MRALDDVNNAYVDTGLFEDAGIQHEGAEYTVAQIGAVHEFGTRDGRIPERSWLRRNHDENIDGYNRALDALYSRVLDGRARLLGGLMAFAQRVAGDIRRTITDVELPILAESTVEKKGSSNPLIDTGAMRNSVDGRVVLSGRKVDA